MLLSLESSIFRLSNDVRLIMIARSYRAQQAFEFRSFFVGAFGRLGVMRYNNYGRFWASRPQRVNDNNVI